jgi:hypothetical protein
MPTFTNLLLVIFLAFVTRTWLTVAKGILGSKKKEKLGRRTRSAVRDLVKSRAVRDLGWNRKEVWRRTEDLVINWK